MIRSLLAASVVALVSSGALAADINGRGGGLKDTGDIRASSVTWTGIYLGGHVGYEFGSHNAGVDVPYKNQSVNLIDLDGISRQGGLAGIDAGVDVRLGNRVVVGVLGVYDFAIENEANLSVLNGAFEGKAEKGDEWGIGGRVGFLLDENDLIYVGAMWMNTEIEVSGAIMGTGIGSAKEDYEGYRLLAGWDHALGGGFFTKLEGSYTDYDNVNWVNKNGVRIYDDADSLQVKLGLTYKPQVKLPGLD